MKSILMVAFYVALAACLWPLFVVGYRLVTYVQLSAAAHKLAQMPPSAVLVSAAHAVLLLWAIPAAVVLFRRQQDSFAWLIVLLILAPVLAPYGVPLSLEFSLESAT